MIKILFQCLTMQKILLRWPKVSYPHWKCLLSRGWRWTMQRNTIQWRWTVPRKSYICHTTRTLDLGSRDSIWFAFQIFIRPLGKEERCYWSLHFLGLKYQLCWVVMLAFNVKTSIMSWLLSSSNDIYEKIFFLPATTPLEHEHVKLTQTKSENWSIQATIAYYDWHQLSRVSGQEKSSSDFVETLQQERAVTEPSTAKHVLD